MYFACPSFPAEIEWLRDPELGQRLKPSSNCLLYGTAEALPYKDAAPPRSLRNRTHDRAAIV
jgi:hypothetical protein